MRLVPGVAPKLKLALACPFASVTVVTGPSVAGPEITSQVRLCPDIGTLLPSRTSNTIGCGPAVPGRPLWSPPEIIRAIRTACAAVTVNCTCWPLTESRAPIVDVVLEPYVKLMLALPAASVMLEVAPSTASPPRVVQSMLRPATGKPAASRTSTTSGWAPALPCVPVCPVPEMRLIAFEPTAVVRNPIWTPVLRPEPPCR